MSQPELNIDTWLHSLPRTEESRRLVAEWLQASDSDSGMTAVPAEEQTQTSLGSTVESDGPPVQDDEGPTVLRDGPTDLGRKRSHDSSRLVVD